VKISTYPLGIVTVVRPREAIAQAETNDLRTAVAEAVTSGSAQIVFDLSEVPFIDSAGLELLIDLQATCTSSGGHLKLAALSDICSEILRLTDLADQFERFSTVEKAAKSLTPE